MHLNLQVARTGRLGDEVKIEPLTKVTVPGGTCTTTCHRGFSYFELRRMVHRKLTVWVVRQHPGLKACSNFGSVQSVAKALKSRSLRYLSPLVEFCWQKFEYFATRHAIQIICRINLL